MTYKSRKGFTLIELMVVIGILAVLATITVPIVTGVIANAKHQDNKVTAALYTSYMQKFSNEHAGTIYTSVLNDSEKEYMNTHSGQMAFPGFDSIGEATSQNAWYEIRKDACTAIKAYSKGLLYDNMNYFVEKPYREQYAFVYYYLMGEVKLERIENMKIMTEEELINGGIDLEDFWVYLDREGGSGEVLGLKQQLPFYVKVIEYGTGKPLNGATVTIQHVNGVSSVTTSQTGLVVFPKAPASTPIQVSCNYYAGASFPNNQLYNDNGLVVIPTDYSDYAGESQYNPYIIELKTGSQGSIAFVQDYLVWDLSVANGWQSSEYMMDDYEFRAEFKAKESDIYSPQDTTYYIQPYNQNPHPLLGKDAENQYKFLLFGDYDLTIVCDNDSNFKPYTDTVTAGIYGINGDLWHFGLDATEPFTYKAKLYNILSSVSGTIYAENSQQPLLGTPFADFALAESFGINSTEEVVSYVVLQNLQTGVEYQSKTPLVFDGSGYTYIVENLPDGEYDIYIKTLYGNQEKKMWLDNFPSSITIDGSLYSVNAKVTRNDVATAEDKKILVVLSTSEYELPIPETMLTFHRLGYDDMFMEWTDQDGYIDLGDVEKGFYYVDIEFPSMYDYFAFDVPVVVSDDDIVIVLNDELGARTTRVISGTVTAKTVAGTLVSNNEEYFDSFDIMIECKNGGGSSYFVNANLQVKHDSVIYTATVPVAFEYHINFSMDCYGTTTDLVWGNDDSTITFNKCLTPSTSGSEHYNIYKRTNWDNYNHSISCVRCGYLHSTGAHTFSYSNNLDDTNHTKYCNYSTCGYSTTQNHSWGGWTSTGENGTHNRTCSLCSRTQSGSHGYNLISTTAATCTTAGSQNYKCTTCSQTKAVGIAMASHSFTALCNTAHDANNYSFTEMSWTCTTCKNNYSYITKTYHICCSMCGTPNGYRACGLHPSRTNYPNTVNCVCKHTTGQWRCSNTWCKTYWTGTEFKQYNSTK